MESTFTLAVEAVSSTLYTALDVLPDTNVVLWPYGEPIYAFVGRDLTAEHILSHQDLCDALMWELGREDASGWAELVYRRCQQEADLLPGFKVSDHPTKGLVLEFQPLPLGQH